MFMPYLMFRKTYSSGGGGGGVHGKADGIALIIMTEGGVITEAYLLSTETFPQAGEMITETADGKDISGKVSGYRISSFSATGAAGKETGTGKNVIPGACRDCLPEKGRATSDPVRINQVNSRENPRENKDVAIVREKADRKDMMEDRAA
jgi:hypothetical protein